MKRSLLLLLALGLGAAYSTAQPMLEHTYPDRYSLFRQVVDSEGEVYSALNPATSEIELYRGDHTLWRTIDFPTSGNLSLYFASRFNRMQYNLDTLLEYDAIFIDPATGIITFTYVNELGQPAFPDPGSVLQLDTAFKYLTDDHRVYALPDYTLEHVYDSVAGYIELARLDAGWKYQVNAGNHQEFYNPDHTLWKEVTVPNSIGGCPTGYLQFYSQHIVNADDLLEMGFQRSCNGQSQIVLLNETGEILHAKTFPLNSIWTWQIVDSSQTGLPFHTLNVYFNDNSTQIYRLPEFTLFLGLDDMKYAQHYTTDLGTHLLAGGYTQAIGQPYPLLHPDGTPWKEISLIPGTNWSNIWTTEHVVDNDDDLDLFFGYFTTSGANALRIINEAGQSELTVTDMAYYTLSEIDGLPFKLLFWKGQSSQPGANEARVYSFGQSVPAPERPQPDLSPEIFPNPVDDVMLVRCEAAAHRAGTITLFDLQGRALLHQPTAGAMTRVDWPGGTGAGIYFAVVQVNGQQALVRVVKP
jgi:hypothetical protein